MKTVLTVAGFDASNGAGVTKDLEVFSYLGLFGFSVPTCFVVQGPKGANRVAPVSPDLFSEMLERAGADAGLSGVKVGVLPDSRHVDSLIEFLGLHGNPPVVADPVRAAKNGLQLVADEAAKAFEARLLSHLACLTPNLDEAGILLGRKIDDPAGMEWAARELFRMGPKSVVIKGGHLPGAPIDLLFDGEHVFTHEKGRIDREVHGTGCLFSSCLLSYMVMGYPIQEAFRATEEEIEKLLAQSVQTGGGGYFYAYPGAHAAAQRDKWQVLQAMYESAETLRKLDLVELIPAVQMNLGYALPNARGVEDVAAFPGRIGRRGGRIYFKDVPEFGASSHVARLCLTCMKHYPFLRAAVDIRYDEATIQKAKSLGMAVFFWDRMKEPEDIKSKEGKSLDFLVDAVLSQTQSPPDIIYDHGDIGKEPIIRLFARNPKELIRKMEMIAP
jgi:hydroxymethylpyrimidine kinase/phosphomethylpyrimidine kinase